MTWCDDKKGSLISSTVDTYPFFSLSKWVSITKAALQYNAGFVTILYSSGNLLL